MFLYAIIPGPKEPSLDQMNSILEPLLIELQMLWNGILFSNTHDFPQVRLIRVALLPLIADLPALRKVAGLVSHSANRFCSFCNITRVEINEIDISKLETRTHENHISKENEWLQLQTKGDQDEFAKSHGVRWSILNKLDYGRPIDFCGIDIMHSLILGDVKDYCISFLKVGLAGHELELQKKKQSFLAHSNPSKYPPCILGCPRKRKNEDYNDSDKISRPKKQNLTKANLASIQPPTSQRHKGSSEASRTKSDQTAKRNRTSSSRYSLRSQTTTSTVLNLLPFTHGSDSLVPSDLYSDDNQYLNPMGDEAQRLKKDE
ncbi:hypothetical protein O181_031829 [Austropuccinia psidii MF-1]|uniref:Uncharacterized protein n=1 Tax=Austropuccinia psidii MF-1 TaxID=1389203 RepID=A0A9Q3H6Z2_9BASI|nr:hypothetical protein [Austropuccinia psidii MF-1]